MYNFIQPSEPYNQIYSIDHHRCIWPAKAQMTLYFLQRKNHMLHLKTKNCLLRSNCIFRFLFIHSNEHDLYFCEPSTQVKTPLEYLPLLKINILTTIAKSPPLTLSATFTNTLVNHMNMLRKKQHHNIFPLQTSSTSLAMSNVRSY